MFFADVRAQAAEPASLTVTVYDFSATDGNLASLARNVTAFVTADLTVETNLIMLARADLSPALSEQAFGVSGLVNSEAAAKIGRLTGAKVLVTGQVLRTEGGRIAIVASVLGTQTGRLFAAQVQGPAEPPAGLISELSRKIAQTIWAQSTNLVARPAESRSVRLARILEGIKGKRRPAVSVNLLDASDSSAQISTAEGELGALLLKAGFMVLDAKSDRKPDVEITGIKSISTARHGDMYSCRVVVDLKAQERRSGVILALDRSESTATDSTVPGGVQAAQADAADQLAERILPILAE